MHPIEEAFGKGCNLYKDVLNCDIHSDKAQLRKAYYRTALRYHPDKNPGNAKASQQFQAISLAYQILQNQESREEYDESGVIPSDAIDDDDVAATKQGADIWKQYFDQIFGKVTKSDIDAFASKYKCSDEERRDVLKEFPARKGNLVKMLDFVMLSEPRDASRWVEDFILPAMEKGEIKTDFKDTMQTTLEKLKRKVAKEDAETASNDGDETETDDESSDIEPSPPPKKKAKSTSKSALQPKKSKQKPQSDMSNLIAAIQNKKRGGGNIISSLGARYGVTIDQDQDPLNDADFAEAQAKLQKKKRRK